MQNPNHAFGVLTAIKFQGPSDSFTLRLADIPKRDPNEFPARRSTILNFQLSNLLQMQDSALQSGGGGLGAVVGVEFGEEVADMEFNRDFGDAQGTADFLVAPPFGNELEHLQLALGQFRAVHAFGEPRADDGRDGAFAGVNFPDGVHQFLARGAFQEVGAGASLQGTVDVLLAIVGGEHDDRGFGKLGADGSGGFDPTHAGQF